MTRATLACGAAMLILLSGCGDSGDDKTDAEPRTEATTEAATTEATTEATNATADGPVDFVRTYLATLETGDSRVCGLMTAKYRKKSVAEAIEYDMIRKGGDCSVMVRQVGKDQQGEEVDSSDATLKEISNDSRKAAVKVTYEDPMYSPYTLVLVKVDGQWLVDGEVY